MKRPDAKNPFTPGMGTQPPCLAGREDVRAWLREDVQRIAQGQAARNVVILHAPRGHGKTVLLSRPGLGQVALAQQTSYCLVNGGSLRRDLLDLLEGGGLTPFVRQGVQIKAGVNLVRLLTGSAEVRQGPETALSGQAGAIGMRRLLGTLLAAMNAPAGEAAGGDQASAGAERAPEAKPGLVLVVDEAHTTDLTDLRDLLTAAQVMLDDGLLLVLAGTPGLRPRLRQADATFWDRAERFSPGLLRAEETAQALREPLASEGIGVDPEALQAIYEQTQGYPYFVQHMGRAIWDALPPGADRITADVLEAALPVYAQQREAHYEERAAELISAGLDEVAILLGRRLHQQGREPSPNLKIMLGWMREALEAGLGTDWKTWRKLAKGPALQRDPDTQTEMMKDLDLIRAGTTLPPEDLAALAEGPALAYLSAKGFVWQPEASGFRLGIPSLHAHLVAKASPAPEAPSAKAAPDLDMC